MWHSKRPEAHHTRRTPAAATLLPPLKIAGVIEMVSEALAVAEKHGVGGDSVLGFIEAFFPAPPIVVGIARTWGWASVRPQLMLPDQAAERAQVMLPA